MTVEQMQRLWPSFKEFAEDVGITQSLAWKWRSKNSIPSKYWNAIYMAARNRKIRRVNLTLLCDIANGLYDSKESSKNTPVA